MSQRAVIYLRVSTDEQTQSGLGLEAQECACRKFCEHSDFDITGIFRDEGVSGKTSPEGRAGFMAAAASMKRGDVLVVAKRDRLARDREAVVAIERAVRNAKGIILSAEGEGTSLDDSDPFAKLFCHMIDAFSQFERGMISHRTKAALQIKRAKGQRISHNTPYGYRVGPDGIHLEECLKEKSTLRRMRELRNEGYPYRRVASTLTEEGTFNREGKAWQHASLHRILTRKPIAALEAASYSENDRKGIEDGISNKQLAGVGTK